MNRLPRKRDRERRKVHPLPIPSSQKPVRIKDTRKRPMNAAESRHADRLAKMGCLICKRPAQIHHETRVNGRRDHRFLVPLCPAHHTDKPGARHKLKVEAFNALHGVDLVAWAKREWAVSCELERAA